MNFQKCNFATHHDLIKMKNLQITNEMQKNGNRFFLQTFNRDDE
jgi:hypothetical protein